MRNFLINELKKLNVINESKLIEYVDFCLNRNVEKHMSGETENHHILPKAKTLPFQEFKNLKENSWNCVFLKYEDHYIAHSLLAEAANDNAIIYGWHRLNMIDDKSGLITPRLYKKLRERHYKVVSKNTSKANKGKVDVILNDKIVKISKDDPRYISGELVSHHKGKTLSDETRRKISEVNSGKNSVTAIKVLIYDENNKLRFKCHGDFKTVCKNNKLPLNMLIDSYMNNGKRIYNNLTERSLTMIKNNGNIKFKNWYAKKEGKNS